MPEINLKELTGGMSLDGIGFSLRVSYNTAAGLTIPSFLSASVSGTSVNLSWTNPSSVSEFNVYQDGMLIGTATGTSYAVSGLAETTSYSYTVRPVVNGSSDASTESNLVTVTTGVPIPYNNVFAINGDSRMEYAAIPGRTYNSGTPTDYLNNAYKVYSRSWFWSLQAELGNNIYVPRGAQFAIAAETTDIIAARATQDAGQAAALGVGNVIFCAGVNDNGVLTPAQSIENYETIFSAFNAQGIRVICLNEMPRDASESSPTDHLAKVNWLSDPLRESEYNLLIIDTFNALKQDGTNCSWVPEYTYDGTHPTYEGNQVIKDTILAAIQSQYSLSNFPALIVPPDNATTGDYVNPSNLLTGTSGTITGPTIAAGDVPDGCRLTEVNATNNIGLTITPSIDTNPDGYSEMVLAVSGSSASTSSAGQGVVFSLQEPTNPHLSTTAGQRIRMVSRVEIDAGAQNIYAVESRLLIRGTAIKSGNAGSFVDQSSGMAATRFFGGSQYFSFSDGEALSFDVITPEIILPDNWNDAGASGQRIMPTVTVYVHGDNEPVSVVARISQVGVLVVDS